MKANAALWLVLLWTALRAGEILLSVTNTLRLVSAGAIEFCRRQHPWLLTATAAAGALAGLACTMTPTVSSSTQLIAGVGFVAFESLHVWAIVALGRRWTTGVLVIPEEAPIRRGPYRWLRHPGYLGGATAAALLPLAAGNWQFTVIVAVFLVVVVQWRIRCEDAAWAS